MNRQPFVTGGRFHYYDEDLDQQQDLGHNITLRFVCVKRFKNPRAWRMLLTNNLDDDACVGQINPKEGRWNVCVWKHPHLDARIKGLTTMDDAVETITQLIRILFR